MPIAQTKGWQDHGLGLSFFSLALTTQSQDIKQAGTYFEAAMEIFKRNPESRLHRAYVASNLASCALVDDHPQDALNMILSNIDVAHAHENAKLLATLLLLKAKALENLGRRDEARSVRLDSLRWAGYRFSS